MCQAIWTSDWHLYHNNILNYAGRTAFMTDDEITATKESWKDARENNNGRIRLRVNYSQETMNRMMDAIVDNINSIEGIENKTVWNLGDVTYGVRWDADKLYYKLKEFREKLRCANLCLVWGNHDKRLQWWRKSKYSPITKKQFYDIFDFADHRYTIRWNRHKIIVDHYPMLSWESIARNAWQLHGHCHGNLEPWKWDNLPHIKQFDVGIDAVQPVMSKKRNAKPEDYRPWTYEDIKNIMDDRKGQAVDHHSPGMELKETKHE